MDHPKAIGDRSTLAIMLALHERGYSVWLPFGENTRCDLIIDEGHALSRVQCKTARLRSGCVTFKTCSSYAHHPNPKERLRDYIGEVDYFAVYCPPTSRVYLVPIGDLESRLEATLRLSPPRNAQRRRIRFADRYEVARVEVASTEEPAATAGAG